MILDELNAPSTRGTIAVGAARYVDGTEVLRLTVFNAAAGVAIAFTGRTLVDGARICPFQHSLVPSTNRAASTFDLQLPAGWLLGSSVRLSAGTPVEGQTFAAIAIGMGTGSQFTELEQLAADTLTATHKVAWPGGSIVGPLAAAGAIRSITGTDPGAGVEVSETVPTGARWIPRALRVVLVTSAVAATRELSLVIDDGATVLVRMPARVSQIASLTVGYSAARLIQATGIVVDTEHTIALADIVMLAGWRIRTITSAIDVGDNYGAPQLLIEERIEGA